MPDTPRDEYTDWADKSAENWKRRASAAGHVELWTTQYPHGVIPPPSPVRQYELDEGEVATMMRRSACLALGYNLLDGSSLRQVSYITEADLNALSDDPIKLPPGTVIKVTVEYAPVEETITDG